MKLVAEGHLWDISLGGQVAGGVRKYEKMNIWKGGPLWVRGQT